MSRILDKNGLVKDNQYMVLYYPHKNVAMPFRIVGRYNALYPTMDYGKLPIDSGDTISSLDSGTASVAADGRMPARSYVEGEKFDMSDVYDTTDMWYIPKDWNHRIFHVHTYLKPAFIRIGLQIPINVTQSRFQNAKVMTGVGTNTGMGYNFGEIETVHLPDIHYGYNFANDTNVAVPVYVKFVYGEYLVKIPDDPDFVCDLLNKDVDSHWVTMPITGSDTKIEQSLNNTWGFEGFNIYPRYKRRTAVQEYTNILGSEEVKKKKVLG